MSATLRVEPLLVRPGAKYTCHGDGLCCTDIHAIGALEEHDCEFLTAISEDAVTRHPTEDASVLMMQAESGACVFLGEGGCALHARLGPENKPSPCIRFPFGLTATPRGGRISTQHRCPCRTVAPGPELQAEDARPSLIGHDGRLKPDATVAGPISWNASLALSFEDYEVREAELIDALIGGQSLRSTLGQEPFPALGDRDWRDVIEVLRDCGGPSRAETAALWFADALDALIHRAPRQERARPWANAFARAKPRATVARSPNAVFGDWIADELWSLRWLARGDLARARAEWATRLLVARQIANWIADDGERDDLAAAEAVMVVEVIAHSDPWDEVLNAFA